MQGQIPFSGLQYVGRQKLEIAFLSLFFWCHSTEKRYRTFSLISDIHYHPRGGGPISTDIDLTLMMSLP